MYLRMCLDVKQSVLIFCDSHYGRFKFPNIFGYNQVKSFLSCQVLKKFPLVEKNYYIIRSLTRLRGMKSSIGDYLYEEGEISSHNG